MNKENLEWKKLNEELEKLNNTKQKQEKEIERKELQIRDKKFIELRNELLPLRQQRQKIIETYTTQRKPLIEKKLTLRRNSVKEELNRITKRTHNTLLQKCQIKQELYHLLYTLSEGREYYKNIKNNEAELQEKMSEKILLQIKNMDTTFICKNCNEKGDLVIRGMFRETDLKSQLCRECTLNQDPSIKRGD